MEKTVSIVIPLYNEEENVIRLTDSLSKVMDKIDGGVETIIVDDGSTDGSWELLKTANKRDHRFKIIRLRRNFGQTPAMTAGFENARGQIIVTLDADLQNDPEDIMRILDKMKEGYDIVSGWRKDRKDKISRKISSKIANWIIGRMTGARLHDTGCTLKAYKSNVIKNLNLYGEMHRFIPALASWQGISIGELEVNHYPRIAGKSKYTIWRAGKVLLDLFTLKFMNSFIAKPIYVFGGTGMALFFLGVICEFIVAWEKYGNMLMGETPIWVHQNPWFMIGILFLLIGVTVFLMGLLAEMQTRTYHESQLKPTFLVKEKLD
ncbi:MAG: glycosyltransferase family 2 protein [Desulfobacterales bacterium]|nr:glycosyltransferase family 2 protein [Desulfobacterales bacterium]